MEYRLNEKVTKKCSKHNNGKMELFDEKKTVLNTKQATVEVTVKLKRHRSSTGKKAINEMPFRKGSWGDLLTQNRAVEFQNPEKDDRSSTAHKVKVRESKCTFPEVCHSSKSNCLKIPITEELYLETHTHIGDQDLKSQESKKVRIPTAKFALIKENEVLRNEIADLRKEVDKIKARKKPHKEEKAPVNADQVKTQRQQQPILDSKRSPSKRIAETQTDSRVNAKVVDQAALQLDKSLEMENAALRREAQMLVEEVSKAKQDQHDYITTIKELYQLAEILKNENQLLTASHEEKQKISDRLVEALSENQLLKQHMDVLLVKQDENEKVPDDRVSKIRNVIRDVKTTIAEEICGMEKLRKSNTDSKRESSKTFDFNVEDVSALLNDTQSSEIQRILNTKAPLYPIVPLSEDRSSTQYFGVPNSSPKGSRYRPSPRQNELDLSPRVSTPAFSVPLTKEGIEMRHGTGDADSLIHAKHGNITPGDRQIRSEQDLYRIESCQSFMPLPVDIIHDDDSISTSDYRSTSSQSSPNRRVPTY